VSITATTIRSDWLFYSVFGFAKLQHFFEITKFISFFFVPLHYEKEAQKKVQQKKA